ncbi:stage II sporulation protein P [Caldalkalibacillus mannanilyticus]|uniref:stage II sporulation protein P n=1 Tax=Caldalkalibacillus mannanilyticus TaxID=1418 RepID=UPI0006874615|nr:stage II sporulation protein P [Caldalkalibacillus mannanilyticus]
MPLFRPRTRRTFRLSPTSIRKSALYLIIGFVLLFSLTSLGSYVQSKIQFSSVTLKKWTTHVSKETFISTLSMEIPALQLYNRLTGIQTPKASTLLLETAISFNPQDPRSLIRNELPGFALFDGHVVVAGQGVNYTDFPMESSPPLEVVMAQREAAFVEEEKASDKGTTEGDAGTPALTTEGRKVVLIYHTHNTESWLPHLPEEDNPSNAYHPEVNITLIGKRLGEELEKRGIGAHVDTTDITRKLHEANKPFAFSYAKSREVVQEVLAQQQDILFMFDLHRDALPRERTTTEINGKSYARTLFLIGGKNANFEKNQKFAERFHDLLEESYPGLSRGVFLKNGNGNGEYNQSLSENNLLIEIGGVGNTVDESYRTAEVSRCDCRFILGCRKSECEARR